MVVVWILVGVIVGIFATLVYVRKLVRNLMIGTLVIDRSIPDEPPYLFTELNRQVHEFHKEKYILMKVENRNYISQE